MKIALINNLYEPVARGGAERIVELQAEILRQAGHKVIIVTTRPWGLKLPKSDDGLLRVGGLAGSFYHLDKLPKPLRLLWHWLSWCDLITPWSISLRLALTGCKVAVGHNLTGLSLWLPRFLAGCNIKYIQVLHDIQYFHPSGLLMKGQESMIKSPAARSYQLMTRHWLKPASKVISPSAWLAELFAGSGVVAREKITALPNPIKLSDAITKKASMPFTFLYIGQLEYHKGTLELLKAFGELSGEAELIVAGDGSLLSQVRDFSQKDPRVKALGRVNRAEVGNLLAKASMFVLPSICYENFPTVILEAFAQRLPAMGSDWGGTKELLDEGRGLLVNPLDHQAFTASLQVAASLDEASLKAYADCAYRKVAEFETEIYSKKFLALIEN